MATCPQCGGHLHDAHRCQGLWRLKLRMGLSWLLAGIASAVVTGVVFYLIYGRVSWLSIALAAVGGALVRRALQLGEP